MSRNPQQRRLDDLHERLRRYLFNARRTKNSRKPVATQKQLTDALGKKQSFWSKYEASRYTEEPRYDDNGKRIETFRLDVFEFVIACEVLDLDPTEVIDTVMDPEYEIPDTSTPTDEYPTM